jgi:hypothetical protein
VPYDERRMGAVDVQPRKRDAQVPAGQQAHERGVREVPSNGDKLHGCLLPEQRLPQYLRRR